MTRKHLLLLIGDFIIALVGAYVGVSAFFWQATVHCGP